LAIDDEKIMNLDGTSAKTPVQVLQEYCNREGTHVHYQSEELAASETKTRFVVTAVLDQLQAEGAGKTKKEAKQRAAQLLLKQLHADINTWGELLESYELQKIASKDKVNIELLVHE
jgi:dsRNA-specific ribonuclease